MPQEVSQTQRSRRFKYGLNVAVAAAAAVALVVLVNWIGYRHFMRFDLTATRQYSLSPQTRNVLEALEGEYRIMTLLSSSGPYVEQARDLADEYKRYGKGLTTEHIDPGRELGRMDGFFDFLRGRFQDQLEPVNQTIADGRSTLGKVSESVSVLLPPLRVVLEDPALVDADLRLFIQSLSQAFSRLATDIQTVDKRISQILDQPLPRFAGAKSLLRNLLVDLNEKIFALAMDRLSQAAGAGQTPASVAERLLEVTAQLDRVRKQVVVAASQVEESPTVEDYDKLVGQLDSPEVVVVVSPDQIRVIGLGEMFRRPDPKEVQSGQQAQMHFQGEEKLTGALVSMSLKHRPLVVFVSPGQRQALGPRGEFEQVAQRLRNVNFQVEQWSPTAQQGPMGQPMPPGSPPEPQPGQKAVWIILPSEAANPMNPMATGGSDQVADLFQERLVAGDAALVMVSLSPMARFGSPDPVAQALTSWGITPQIDRLVLRQVVLPNHQTRASSQLDIDDWGTQLPITIALAGMPGVFVQASPLVLGAGQDQAVKVWPLVQVSGAELWAERDVVSNQNPKLDPATAGGPFVIAAAAQRNDNRLVVVGDPVWATDQITTMGPQGLPAEIFGTAFPGNAELFVNSVYWLAQLDQLIAASPRTQDIRRVGPMTDAGLVTLRWALLLGLPLAVLLAGVSVWSVRRRG